MTPSDLPPEFVFLRSPTGVWISLLVSMAMLLLTLVWVRRPERRGLRAERALAVEAAALTALLVIGITVLAVKLGWWQGDFFTALPPLVLFAIYLPFTIAGYTLWLGIYRWLRGKTRYAFWIYAGLVLLFIPVVFLVDPIQMQRGQFSMGGGYTILADALV